MIYRTIFILLLSMHINTDDYSEQRGMTKLLGHDTYLRCSNYLSNPKAKTRTNWNCHT